MLAQVRQNMSKIKTDMTAVLQDTWSEQMESIRASMVQVNQEYTSSKSKSNQNVAKTSEQEKAAESKIA